MIKAISIASIIFLSAFLTSCSSLKSPYYIGEKTEFSEKEVGKETVWKVDKDIYHVRIVSSNEVVASTTKWDEKKKKYLAETHELVISELDDHHFVNLKQDDLYGVFRIAASDESIVFYTVDSDEIKKHIASGKVEPTKDKDTYLLKGSKDDIDEFILENIKTLFDQNAIVVGELISGEL